MSKQENSVEIHPLRAEDYAAVMALWQGCDGIRLRQEDASETFFRRFVTRNSGLCLGAWEADRLIGAVLVGHDSRRAYLYHLAVAKTHRKQGIGRRLVQSVLRELDRIGITKAHLFVETDNDAGLAFWRAIGAEHRTDLAVFSLTDGCGRCMN
ncbi:MAG: GNAT family N-acetyltransferase [Hydrogenophilales bacterium CG_4_9_14_3_um_filter_59_35]|nr:MAG: GNAT family N-acetyltransferase [Hydrogenophilales bacterium CG18_big_fil_WC_8_21_14_2_50_58_12]PJB07857.1 MAG: GNAT family N-acetyltransferase [Hydrogenophilales bacterium CG_4_9_14_3_um_filter_59_35]